MGKIFQIQTWVLVVCESTKFISKYRCSKNEWFIRIFIDQHGFVQNCNGRSGFFCMQCPISMKISHLYRGYFIRISGCMVTCLERHDSLATTAQQHLIPLSELLYSTDPIFPSGKMWFWKVRFFGDLREIRILKWNCRIFKLYVKPKAVS